MVASTHSLYLSSISATCQCFYVVVRPNRLSGQAYDLYKILSQLSQMISSSATSYGERSF